MSIFSDANKVYHDRNYVQALSLYTKSIEQNEPYTAQALYNSAVCYINLKKYKDAVPLLEQAISMKQNSHYYFNLGYCYAYLNNKKKALLYFNTAWALNNDDLDCEKAINKILGVFKKY